MSGQGWYAAGYGDEPTRAYPQPGRRLTRQRVRGIGLIGALSWTASGTLLPGIGLIRAGKRVSGVLALVFLTIVIGSLVYLRFNPQTALRILANVRVMQFAALGLVVVGAAWAALSVATYWSLAPRHLGAAGRCLGGVTVAFFTFAVTTPLLIGAQYAVSSANALSSIFTDGPTSVTVPTFAPGDDDEPWANQERLNVLFLGYDRGIGRTEDDGGLTDTIMVASIDTASGNTVLISIPRETAMMPFPLDSPLFDKFPYGWYDGYNPKNNAFYLNAMYLTLPLYVDDDIIGPTSDLGADAVKLSVGEALGLKIDYYVLVNIDGATELVDAIGGIYMNINSSRIPKGDPDLGLGFFTKGPNQYLDGEDALLYARSRKYDDDFQRNGRQRCVMKAVLDQAEPTTLLTRYEAIAAASSDMIRTDIPATMIPALFDLVVKVKNQGVLSGMGFADGEYGFYQWYPDFEEMAERVQEAIDASVGKTPEVTSSAAPSESTSAGVEPAEPSGGATPSASATSAADMPVSANQNLDDFCAYNPE